MPYKTPDYLGYTKLQLPKHYMLHNGNVNWPQTLIYYRCRPNKIKFIKFFYKKKMLGFDLC